MKICQALRRKGLIIVLVAFIPWDLPFPDTFFSFTYHQTPCYSNRSVETNFSKLNKQVPHTIVQKLFTQYTQILVSRNFSTNYFFSLPRTTGIGSCSWFWTWLNTKKLTNKLHYLLLAKISAQRVQRINVLWAYVRWKKWFVYWDWEHV